MTDETKQAITPREKRRAKEDRLAALTDAVVAIVMTLLVLDIKVPDLGSGESVSDALSDIAPTFNAFIVSFLLVGMYWVWHRGVFAQVRYVDKNVLWLNLLFLLPLSLIPFAASTVGEHSDDPTALHIYGTVLIAVTFMRIALDRYLNRHPGLLYEAPTSREKRMSTLAAAAPLAIYTIAMVVAVWLPALSLLMFFSVPFLYLGFVAFLQADPRTMESAQDLS